MTDGLFARIFTTFPLRTCTVVYRREVIRDFLSSPLLSIDVSAGDRALAGYCAANWRVRYLDVPTSVYRVAPGSATRQGNDANIEMYRGIVRLYERFRKYYGSRPDFDHSFADTCYAVLAVKAIRVGDRNEFDRCIAKMRDCQHTGLWKTVDMGIRNLGNWPALLSTAVWIWDLRIRAMDRLYLLAVRYLNFGVVGSEPPGNMPESGDRRSG